MVYSLFTASKDFTDPWIGHPGLNRLGAHSARMRLASACNASRRGLARLAGSSGITRDQRASFLRDGYLKIENFLPAGVFEQLAEEVRRVARQTEEETPFPPGTRAGFQQPQKYDWGIDRFDGGTLNRFINIRPQDMPRSHQFSGDPRLASLSRLVVGAPVARSRVRIYQTVHGDEANAPDLQKDYHRDTFFSAMKFWFYIDPVRMEEGPFVFVPGSHKLTGERLAWERRKAQDACNQKRRHGAFRIDEDELEELGLARPLPLPVEGNTLVIADTLGFHRRGDAVPGSRRLSMYGSCRPWPFLAIGR